jgi:putative ABC transport system permease protein
VLVLAQVALAVVLVVGAAHLIETFRQLRGVDPGFRAAGVLTAALPLTESHYETDESIESFYREVLRRTEVLPGVQSAGVVSTLPMSGQSMSFSVELRDPGGLTEQDLIAGYQSVSAGYFEAMGIDIVSGRPFSQSEGATDEPVVIVDEAFEARFFPNGAVGQELLAIGDAWRRVVGVVRSVKRSSLRADPSRMFYVPLGQDPRDAMTLVVRISGDPAALVPAVRAVVADIDPGQPVASVATMESLVSSSLAQPRFTAAIVGFFGMATLLLAMRCMASSPPSSSVAPASWAFAWRWALARDRSAAWSSRTAWASPWPVLLSAWRLPCRPFVRSGAPSSASRRSTRRSCSSSCP